MKYIFILLYALLLLISLLLEKQMHNRHSTPLLFFVDTWCCVGMGSNIGLYDYYLPSDLVNVMIISVIVLSMIFWLAYNKTEKLQVEKLKSNKCTIEYRLICMIVLEIVFLMFMLPNFIFSLNALKSGIKMDYLRAYVYDSKNNNGYIEELRGLIAKPFMTLTSLIAIVSIFNHASKNKKLFLWTIAIINIVVYTISTSGRLAIVNLGSYFVIALVLYNDNRISIFFHNHKRLLLIMGCSVLAVVFISSQRSSISPSKSFYIYYFSGPSYLTQILELNESVFSINNDFMFGTATFGFICNFFSYFLILITHKSRGSLYLLGSVLTSESHYVAENIRVNAMCTCIYDFLVDWGYIGILIGPMCVMYIAYRLMKYDEREGSLTSKCLVIYYLNILFNSIFKWGLISMEFSMVFIYLMILCKPVSSSQKEVS